jgi:hypothetical protein
MPALLRIKKYIANDVWSVNFALDTASLSEADKNLMQKFGEPIINIGGVYLDGTSNEYTIPNQYIRIRSDLPFTQEFDSKSPVFAENTQVQAEAFQDEFVARYTAAFTALRNNADTFTGEYIENI